MKWIGDKISYEKHDDFLTIIITGKTESWKANLVLVWIVAWLGAVFQSYISVYTQILSKGNNGMHILFLHFGFIFFTKYRECIYGENLGWNILK